MKIVCTLMLCFVSVFSLEPWVSTGELSGYPKSEYLTGVGRSTKNLEDAKTNAVVAIKQQISVDVHSKMSQRKSEVTMDSDDAMSSEFKKNSQLQVSGEIQGVEIVKTSEVDGYYAFAVLNKRSFASQLKLTIEEESTSLEKSYTLAQSELKNGQVHLVMSALQNALRNIRNIRESRNVLAAVTSLNESSKLSVTESDIELLMEKAATTVALELKEGNNQIIDPGTVENTPIKCVAKAGGKSIAGISVVLQDELGNVVTNKTTDPDGIVTFQLSALSQKSGRHIYYAYIVVEGNSKVNERFKDQLIEISYTVKQKVCGVNVDIVVDGAYEFLKKSIDSMIKTHEIDHDENSDYTLRAHAKVGEHSTVTGVSKANSFIKTRISIEFEILKKKKSVYSFTKKSSGLAGEEVRSLEKAVKNISFHNEFGKYKNEICP